MADHVVYREAGLADREAVLSIHDNVFEGFDYLPSFYTSYVQNKWNRCYVAEVDGKVVSFISHFITDGGRHMISGGARTSPTHQKMGINQRLSNFAIQNTGKTFPQLQIMYSAGNYKPYADKVDAGLVPGVEVLRRMTYLVYDTDHGALHATGRNTNINLDNYKPITSHVEQFLLFAPNRASLFQEGIIKFQANWQILAPTDYNIKKAVRCSYAVVTCGQEDRVLAVSFGSVVGTQKYYAFSYDLDLFIDKSIVLRESERHALCISHIITHVQHAADVSGSGDRVAFELSLPQHVDHEAVRQTLKTQLGEDLKTDEFKDHASCIFKSPYPMY